MPELSSAQKVIVAIIPIIFAITVHEVAHGWVANKLGDPTAKLLGRITLNPIKHIDPIGTVLVPCIMLLTIGLAFGWAKPVPVTWENLKQPKRDMALVALAGPVANIIMALLWGIIAKLGFFMMDAQLPAGEPVVLMGLTGILINLVLGILNLIPIPPLDGSRILSACLSGKAAVIYSQIELFGIVVIVLLLVTGVLQNLFFPIVAVLFSAIRMIFGI